MKHSLFLRLHKNFGAFALLFVCFTLCLPGASGQTFSGTGTRSVLGSQTTALGLTYYGNAAPNVTPSAANWRTVVRFHVDTSAQVQWAFLGSTWKAQGVIRRVTPPPATAINGSATLDYRYAQWQADGDSTRYTYDFQEGCWSPLGVYRHDTIPTNVASGVGTGAVCYEFSPWLNTTNDSLYLYQDGTWLSVGTGSGGGGGGSGVDNFYRDGDTLRLAVGVDTFSVSAVEPDSAVYATLTTLADTAAAIRGDFPSGGGGGVVSSVSTVVDNQIVRYSGTTADTIQNSVVTISDNGTITSANGFSTPSGYVEISENNLSSEAYEIRKRDIGLGIPVPTIRPKTNNTPIALDIMPKGSPSSYYENGQAWIDVCDRDVQNNNSGVVTARIGAKRNERIEFGLKSYGGGWLPLVWMYDTIAVHQYNVDGSWYWRPSKIYIQNPASGTATQGLGLDANNKIVTTALGGGSGISALTGDVTASGTGSVVATITADAVDSTNIASISFSDFPQSGALNFQSLMWNGSNWKPRYVVTGTASQTVRINSSGLPEASSVLTNDGTNLNNTGRLTTNGLTVTTNATAATNGIVVRNQSVSGYTNIEFRDNADNFVGYWGYGNASVAPNILKSRMYIGGINKALTITTDANTTASLFISTTSLTGFGHDSPTARVHPAAGTTSIAPLRIPAGVLRTTPESGSVENDGSAFYWTNSTPTRRRLLDLPTATPTTSHSPVFDGTNWITGAAGLYGGSGNIANNTAATLVANGFFRFVGANGTEVISMRDGTTAGQGSVALYSTRLAYVYGGDSIALWGARVQVKNPTTSLAGLLELHEARNNGTNSAKLQSPASLSADYTLTLPPDDGETNGKLMTDGSGVLSWQTPSRAEISATATRHYTLTTAATNYTIDTLSSAFLTDFTYSAGVLTYTGTPTKRFLISYALSIATDDSVLLSAGVDKNGAGPLASTRQAASIGTNAGHVATANISGTGIVGLSTNDTLKIVIQSDGAGAPVASVRFASLTVTPID